MTNAVTFWDRAARKYAASPIGDVPAYEKTMERVQSHLSSTDRVLEVGCGTGSTAILLAPFTAEYHGTDISNEMTQIANEKITADPIENLTFSVSDASLDGFETEQYNAVLAFNLYHLVPDMDRALARARRLIKPGGLFITKTPCLARKWYLKPVIKVMQAVGKAPFVRFFSVDDYDASIRDAGFEIVETGLYPPSAPSRFVVARKV